MKIAIVGHGRCGKDTAAEFLAKNTILRYWGSCSQVILPYIAKDQGVSQSEAWETRHINRDLWRAKGDELRESDPCFLARSPLLGGDMVIGVRSRVEMAAIRAENLVDLVLWIDRPGIAPDPTLEFGREVSDAVILNDGSIEDFHRRLERFARAFGIWRDGKGTEETVLYLSGPMTDYADHNFPAFDREAMRLRAAGYRVINPAANGSDPRYTWGDFLALDVHLLTRADGVAVMLGWSDSRGAQTENQFARNLGLATYTVDHWLMMSHSRLVAKPGV